MFYPFVPVLLLRTLVAGTALGLVACAAKPLAESYAPQPASSASQSTAEAPTAGAPRHCHCRVLPNGAISFGSRRWPRASVPAYSTKPSLA